MSINLSAVARTEFDAQVKHAFQTAGNLRDTVTIRNNVVGDIYKFRKMGKGLANQKASQDDVTPMDVSHSLITATMENWNAPEYTDIFDQVEVNFDERMELAETIAGALGRRLDQLIINAMNSSRFATAAGTDSTALALADIITASKLLNNNGVPGGDRFCIVTAKGMADMLADTTVSSADYNSIRILMAGDIDTFMGFKWKVIESRSEGGLNIDVAGGNEVDAYCYHKSAVGLAIGIDIKTEVNYIAQKTSWLANGMLKMAAVTRDTDGVIELNYDEVA